MLFSERIRTLRNEQGILQRTLAKAIGVDVPMYSRYEHGERHPKREQVVKLARLLHTDANELVALWLAEDALNAIGHDKMSARASQLLLETLDKNAAPASDESQGPDDNRQQELDAALHEMRLMTAQLNEANNALQQKCKLLDEKQDALITLQQRNDELLKELNDSKLQLEEKDSRLTELQQLFEAASPVEQAPAQPAADPTLSQAPVIDAAQRTLVASIASSHMPHYETGDARQVMQRIEDESVDCIVTTPPYWSLRRYGADKIEAENLEEFVNQLLRVMAECHRVLKPQGSLWMGVGDAYDNHSLQGVPWRLAIAMMDLQGWTLRNDVVLNTGQNATDNTHTHLRNMHEYAHLGTKGLMPTDIWEIAMPKSPVERYVTAPEELCRLAIVATCPAGGLVLDPYCGTGTTGKVAYNLNRRFIGIDINPDRLRLARSRVEQKSLSLF